jgi:hypothetical protein
MHRMQCRGVSYLLFTCNIQTAEKITSSEHFSLSWGDIYEDRTNKMLVMTPKMRKMLL